jgi:hypothetical protein
MAPPAPDASGGRGEDRLAHGFGVERESVSYWSVGRRIESFADHL